jgi:hypothetical protein
LKSCQAKIIDEFMSFTTSFSWWYRPTMPFLPSRIQPAFCCQRKSRLKPAQREEVSLVSHQQLKLVANEEWWCHTQLRSFFLDAPPNDITPRQPSAPLASS